MAPSRRRGAVDTDKRSNTSGYGPGAIPLRLSWTTVLGPRLLIRPGAKSFALLDRLPLAPSTLAASLKGRICLPKKPLGLWQFDTLIFDMSLDMDQP